MQNAWLEKFAAALVALMLLALSGCAANGPYNSTSDGADSVLMLKGHDPVAYFTAGRHTLGRPDIKAVHEGATYRFSNEENRAAFVKEPARYAPQFGGFCANGIAYGIPWGGDPDTWKIIDGRLYIFGGESSRKYFLMDEKRNIGLADAYWKDEISGSHALPQRYKRLVMRVPHYRTGKELEQEWQRKQAPK